MNCERNSVLNSIAFCSLPQRDENFFRDLLYQDRQGGVERQRDRGLNALRVGRRGGWGNRGRIRDGSRLHGGHGFGEQASRELGVVD